MAAITITTISKNFKWLKKKNQLKFFYEIQESNLKPGERLQAPESFFSL